MRLTPMRYKEFTWPHNPEIYTVEYRRQLLTRLAKDGGELPAETVNPAFDQGRFDALRRE